MRHLIKNKLVPEKRTLLKPLLLTVIWACVIFVLCNMKIGASGPEPWYYFEGLDKAVHACLFFVLGLLSYWGFYRQRKWPSVSRNAALYAFLLCMLYGGLIEILQGLVFTYRSADWMDWVFDIGGTLLGIWVFGLLKK